MDARREIERLESLPLSRPLNTSGIAVVNIEEHQVQRIPYSPLPQLPSDPRVNVVDGGDEHVKSAEGRRADHYTDQGAKLSPPAYAEAIAQGQMN